MSIRLRSAVAIALLAPLSGCFLWPSTHVEPPSWAPQPPVEGSAYTPGQPSQNPEITFSQPGLTGSTLAGSGGAGSIDGQGIGAQFKEPEGIALAPDGTLYVAEPYAYRIRKVLPDGRVSTLAGGTLGRGDGTGTGAQFFGPKDLVVDGQGSLLVADFDSLRQVTPDGRVTTLSIQTSDGPWAPVELLGIARGSDGVLYVSTTTGIDRIQGGVASRWVGTDAKGYRDGNGTAAYFNLPRKLAVDSQNNLYVADYGNLRIRKVSPDRQVTTVAGNGILGFIDGASPLSRLNFPTGLAVDTAGNVIVADTYNHAIRKLAPDGRVTTLAGNNYPGFREGAASVVQFDHPTDVAVSADGRIFVVDRMNHRIRVIQ
jgi:sugar lactone lactonase YvrE